MVSAVSAVPAAATPAPMATAPAHLLGLEPVDFTLIRDGRMSIGVFREPPIFDERLR